MVDSSDMVIFWLVVAARLLVPLAIPRFPLPAVITALVLDGVDQTIFQKYTNLPLDGYQSYDKALDIYYLTVAYISTMRNWTHLLAFKASRFLFYYRLVGVVLFEATQIRTLLLIFPNTFEYFFIFYEAVRLRWNPLRMSRRLVLGAVAFIWIFIKLPQEYWIHVAQIDTTDFIKEEIFGVPASTTFSELVAMFPMAFVALIAVVLLLLVAAWWYITRRLPAKDYPLSFSADAGRTEFEPERKEEAMAWAARKLLTRDLVEKVAMVGLVSLIFGNVLPNVQATVPQFALGLSFVIVLNTALSQWLSRRGHTWNSILREFVVMAVVNFGLATLYVNLLPQFDGQVPNNVFFFALLLTLLVVLYDRYRVTFLQRFPGEA